MKKQQLFSLMFLLFFCANLLAQTKENKPLQISPYAGIALPQGDFKDFSENGSVFGIALDKYFKEKFALGFDINHQTNDFKNPFDYSSLPSTYSVLTNDANKWSVTNISFGPTYKLGNKKITTEIYAKGGLSLLKTPKQNGTFTGTGIQDINIFDLKSESSTSFGLTSGIRFNYAINDKLSFFVNPQYVYSGNEIEYFHRPINGTANPDLLAQDGGELCYVRPTYFNVNAGIKFNLGIGDKPDKPSANPNFAFCDIKFDNTECYGSGQNIQFTSTWSNQISSSIITVKLFDANNNQINATITNSNQTIGVATGSFIHTLTLSGYSGTTLRVEMSIVGAVVCNNPNSVFFETQICEPEECAYFEINQATSCNMKSGFQEVNITTHYTNVPVGSTLNYTVLDVQTNQYISYGGSSFPVSINGTGNKNDVLTFLGNFSGPIIINMEILDANANVICNDGDDSITLNGCNFKTCDLVEIEASCNNENPFMAFSVDWSNYTNFSNYSIYVDIVGAIDASGTTIPGFVSTSYPPFQLTGSSGSKSFNENVPSQYAGATILLKSRICETASNGIKSCCFSELKIKIPKCCVVCSDITLDDTTDVNQSNAQIFRVKGNINPVGTSSPVKKIVAQLEAISFSDRSSPSTPAPNYEFIGGWFANIGGSFTPNINGSLLGDRSNLLVIDVNATTATNMVFILNIDNYSNKIVEEYRIKLTIFKQDGTYCEKEMYYSRWLEFWRNYINNN